LNIDLLGAALSFAVLLVSLTIHEAAHAWTADRLGDPTARMLGRVSLNPARHIDPIGTLLLPLIAAITNLPIIGWAKPVPVNLRNLQHPRRDFTLVTAAGPLSNFAQAAVASILVHGLVASGAYLPQVELLLQRAILVNLLLAFFNLIPVPPLDGGNIVLGLMPPRMAAVYDQVRQFGFIILYALLLSGVASAIIMPPTYFFFRILIP
jgi:Zn-dependent protease